MMALGNAGDVIRDLNARIGGKATAIVSRNGVVLFAVVPSGVYVDTFAIMCATVLGAATAASTELHRAAPERILIEGADSTTLILGTGGKALLVSVVDRSADTAQVLQEVAQVSEMLRGL
jgi:uncharacterized protein